MSSEFSNPFNVPSSKREAPIALSIFEGIIDDGLYKALSQLSPLKREPYLRGLLTLSRQKDAPDIATLRSAEDLSVAILGVRKNIHQEGVPEGYVRPFAFPGLVEAKIWKAISTFRPLTGRVTCLKNLRKIFEKDPKAIVTSLEEIVPVESRTLFPPDRGGERERTAIFSAKTGKGSLKSSEGVAAGTRRRYSMGEVVAEPAEFMSRHEDAGVFTLQELRALDMASEPYRKRSAQGGALPPSMPPLPKKGVSKKKN